MASHEKMLIRAWLPDRGCCHFRSTEMTDAEARGLLDAARGAIEQAQGSGGVEEVPVTKGRAFVMALRSPDPNHPGRTAPGFVLISVPDPDAFLRDAVAAELRSVPVPEASDTLPEGWKLLDLGATPREAFDGSGQESKAARLLVVSCHRFLDRPARYAVIPIILSSIALFKFVALPILHHSGTMPGRNDSPTPPTADSSEVPGSKEKEWNRDREKIENLLQESWAKKILGEARDPDTGVQKTARNLSDRRILEAFARLFRRPNLVLQGKDRRNFEQLKPEEHPFVDFLNRLPESPPELHVGDAPLSASQALDYLEDLKGKMKGLDLNLDFDGAEGIAQPIHLALDYDDFFDKWAKKNPSSSHKVNGPLDEGREGETPYRWVGEVRKVIRVYCQR